MATISPQDTGLLFDLDGTLLDSRGKLARDVQAAFGRLGKQVTLKEALGFRDWNTAVAERGLEWNVFWNIFKEVETSYADAIRAGTVRLFPDTIPTLGKLHEQGYQSAIVTRSTPEFTEQKVRLFGLGRYFSQVAVTTPSRHKAPNKVEEMWAVLCGWTAPKPVSLTVIVGDSEIDDVGAAPLLRARAKQAGHSTQVRSVYVNRHGVPLEVHKADYEITDLRGLPGILEQSRADYK